MSLTSSERFERVVFNGGAGGFCLLWMLAVDPTLRTSAFTVAVAAYGLLALLAWSDGVPVEPPQREQPITLNLSSR
jgi:hypothetical protein